MIWNRAVAAFRVTPVDGEAFDVKATPVPGGKVWVAVVDRDLATPNCAPTRPGQHKVEALDAAGTVIGCVNGL